jgi:hypothetical protein
MYTVIDVTKFLDEISPLIVQRLKKMHDWNGQLQITCENVGKLYKKEGENVQALPPANRSVECSITVAADTLTGVLLGAVDAQKAWSDGVMKVQTRLTRTQINELLTTVFPKKQFLALDYW